MKGELILAICGIDLYFEDSSKVSIDDTTIRMLIDETNKILSQLLSGILR